MMNLDITSSLIYVYCPILCFLLSLSPYFMSSPPPLTTLCIPALPPPSSHCMVLLRWLKFQGVLNKYYAAVSVRMRSVDVSLTCLPNNL